MIYICENILDIDVQEALRQVSADRRSKALCYRFDIDRRQSLGAYLLLRYGLRLEYGIDAPPRLAYHDGGKPFIADYRQIHFNISHCCCGVACAIGSSPVGVDIEAIEAVDWDVARRVMSSRQFDDIASSPDPGLAFCKLWTTKESILKHTGEGLCDDLPRLAIDNYSFAHYYGRNYVCTACYSHAEQREEFRIVSL